MVGGGGGESLCDVAKIWYHTIEIDCLQLSNR